MLAAMNFSTAENVPSPTAHRSRTTSTRAGTVPPVPIAMGSPARSESEMFTATISPLTSKPDLNLFR